MGHIKEIASIVFEELNPKAIFVLTALPEIISERLKARDGIFYNVQIIENFGSSAFLVVNMR